MQDGCSLSQQQMAPILKWIHVHSQHSQHQNPPFATIEEAIKDIAEGKFVVVVDNEDRENEGDLIIAADSITKEKMAFMIRYTSGVICIPMLEERLQQLGLPQMVEHNTDNHSTAYTISVDYKDTTTGISANDRALTAKALSNPEIIEKDSFRRPGHIFPLRYKKGGVCVREGHTEASVDLCLLAGRQPVAVISEITMDNGNMARRDDLISFSRFHGLNMITIAALKTYLLERKSILE